MVALVALRVLIERQHKDRVQRVATNKDATEHLTILMVFIGFCLRGLQVVQFVIFRVNFSHHDLFFRCTKNKAGKLALFTEMSIVLSLPEEISKIIFIF